MEGAAFIIAAIVVAAFGGPLWAVVVLLILGLIVAFNS